MLLLGAVCRWLGDLRSDVPAVILPERPRQIAVSFCGDVLRAVRAEQGRHHGEGPHRSDSRSREAGLVYRLRTPVGCFAVYKPSSGASLRKRETAARRWHSRGPGACSLRPGMSATQRPSAFSSTVCMSSHLHWRADRGAGTLRGLQ